MDLEQLKGNMSLLNQLLEKTNNDIRIDIDKAENAQSKLVKKYRQSSLLCLIISIAFFMTWLGGVNDSPYTFPYRPVIAIYTLCASIWYFYLTMRIKNIDIDTLSPAKVISKTSTFKLMALSGEILSLILLAVFFSLFIPQLFNNTLLGFWLCIATILVGIIIGLLFYIPKFNRLFQDLNSIKE